MASIWYWEDNGEDERVESVEYVAPVLIVLSTSVYSAFHKIRFRLLHVGRFFDTFLNNDCSNRTCAVQLSQFDLISTTSFRASVSSLRIRGAPARRVSAQARKVV